MESTRLKIDCENMNASDVSEKFSELEQMLGLLIDEIARYNPEQDIEGEVGHIGEHELGERGWKLHKEELRVIVLEEESKAEDIAIGSAWKRSGTCTERTIVVRQLWGVVGILHKATNQ